MPETQRHLSIFTHSNPCMNALSLSLSLSKGGCVYLSLTLLIYLTLHTCNTFSKSIYVTHVECCVITLKAQQCLKHSHLSVSIPTHVQILSPSLSLSLSLSLYIHATVLSKSTSLCTHAECCVITSKQSNA